MAKTVEVTVDKNGDVSIDLHGYHGKGCAAVTKAFTDLLGKVTGETVKREMYEEDRVAVVTRFA